VKLSAFSTKGKLPLNRKALARYLNKARADGQRTDRHNEKAALEMRLPDDVEVVKQ
jgi:hypothetical protein